MSEPKPQGGALLSTESRHKKWRIKPYLRDGIDPARYFHIVTGSLEAGSPLLLDGEWQKLEKGRIPLGAVT